MDSNSPGSPHTCIAILQTLEAGHILLSSLRWAFHAHEGEFLPEGWTRIQGYDGNGYWENYVHCTWPHVERFAGDDDSSDSDPVVQRMIRDRVNTDEHPDDLL